MSDSGRLFRNIDAIFRIFIIIFTIVIVNCSRGESKLRHDSGMSISFTNLPYQTGSISELRIYKTPENRFLSTHEFSELAPSKILSSPLEVEYFFAAMANGRTSSQDRSYKNLDYRDPCFHIIGLNPEKNKYGYIKVRISMSKTVPLVAQVQPLSDTNSIQMMTGLAEFLESLNSPTEAKKQSRIPD